MKKKIRRRRCEHCDDLYKPDPRHFKERKVVDDRFLYYLLEPSSATRFFIFLMVGWGLLDKLYISDLYVMDSHFIICLYLCLFLL